MGGSGQGTTSVACGLAGHDLFEKDVGGDKDDGGAKCADEAKSVVEVEIE